MTDTADRLPGREAILLAAGRAFAKRPYAEVTVRGIAADAGVSPALVIKRFGSKADLFNTVADFSPAADELFDTSVTELGRHLVITVVRMRRERLRDPLLRAVFSLGDSDERILLRTRFRQQVTDRLAERLSGARARLRAELVAGQLLGLGATLALHRPDGAAEQATPEQIADLYAPGLQALINPSV